MDVQIQEGEVIMAVKMMMKGAILPGNSTVEMKDFEIPKPGHGQVVVQTKATMSPADRSWKRERA